MLDSLRKSASSWLVKILLGILVLSFAVWGVADIFRGFNRQKLAEIGGQEISIPEFEHTYQTQIRAISNNLGRTLTSAEARSLGLPQRVLQNLVASTAISIHAHKLRLGIQEKTIVDQITEEPSFADRSGKFDRRTFEEMLRSNGLSEQGFINRRKQDVVRGQILDVLTSGAYVPQTLLDAANRFQNDQRTLKFFIIPTTVAGTVNAPDEAAMKTFYDERKSSFKAPEYRKIGMLLLSADSVKDTIKVPDEDVKASYEANKKKYGTPETRTIQQLIFKDKAAADAAHAKLNKNTDFVKFGQELGMKEGDINMGTFAKDKLADQKIAAAAFQLEKGKVSDVIDGFAPVIVRVTDIKPGSQKTLDEVKDQVRDELAKTRAAELLNKMFDQIEDGRGGGSSLAEIAKKMNLKYDEYTLDAQGNGTDGKKVEALAKLPEVVKLTFTSDVGVENNPVTVSEGSAFVDVREVLPERQKPLSEVQEDVKKAWIETETRKRIEKKTDELMARATGGEKIEKLAETVDAKVTTTASMKRADVQPGLPLNATGQAFSLPVNGFGQVATPDRKSIAIFQVTDVKPAPALDEKQAEALRKQLGAGIGSDYYAQYVNGLQNAYGVSINTKAISDLVGQQ